jgi:hypothetical protein
LLIADYVARCDTPMNPQSIRNQQSAIRNSRSLFSLVHHLRVDDIARRLACSSTGAGLP